MEKLWWEWFFQVYSLTPHYPSTPHYSLMSYCDDAAIRPTLAIHSGCGSCNISRHLSNILEVIIYIICNIFYTLCVFVNTCLLFGYHRVILFCVIWPSTYEPRCGSRKGLWHRGWCSKYLHTVLLGFDNVKVTIVDPEDANAPLNIDTMM